jgi:hypothetical protein
MEDFDIGEQFHNYLLRLCERAFHGVVIHSDLVKTMKEAEPLMRWTRLPFGWSPSPVFALRMLARSMELAKRHPSDSTNACQWSNVVLNLPASPDYDPSKPHVQLLRYDGRIAVGCIAFFDDGHIYAPDNELAQRGIRQMCSSLQWLGNQEATRKRISGGMRPGAWSGACVNNDQNLARKFLSHTKWEKLKLCVKWFLDHAIKRIAANRKMVLEKRGFMVYCGCTYDFIPPYLKVIHLSLEVWRPNKPVDGWQC